MASQDTEKHAINGDGDQGGAALSRPVSVQLSAEQYERLFFQPVPPAHAGLTKRFGNPTPL